MILLACALLIAFIAFSIGVYVGSEIKHDLIKDRIKKAEDRGFHRAVDSFSSDKQHYVARITRLTQQLQNLQGHSNVG